VEKQLHPICDKDDRWDQVKVFSVMLVMLQDWLGKSLEIAGRHQQIVSPLRMAGDNCTIGVKICQLQFLPGGYDTDVVDKRAEGEKVQALLVQAYVGSDLLGYIGNTLTVVLQAPID
jgi:hypothetical protein